METNMVFQNGFEFHAYLEKMLDGIKQEQIEKELEKLDFYHTVKGFPEWIDELFEQCNKNPRDYFDYFHLDKITRYFFKDDSYLDVTSDLELTSKNFEKYSGLESKKFLKYFKLWEKIYEISVFTFFC